MKTIKKIESQIKDLLSEVEKLKKQETGFKVGDYIVANYYAGNDERKGNVAMVTGPITYSYLDGFIEENHSNFSGCAPATKEEVESALIAEAKRRGFKEGVSVKSAYYTSGEVCPLLKGFSTRYESDKDRLLFMGMFVYCNGKWAEIIKDETIKIGGCEVRIIKGMSQDGTTTIDGNVFDKEFWQAAKLISEHNKAKIMVGCSKQFDVSLEVINKILNKLS